MKGHEIRECLHAGRRVFGTHVCSLTNPLTARMQASLEYDFIFVCNEHMPIDRTETAMMCQYYAARGISPIVRIPTCQPQYAAAALDAGAEGIVVPYLETVEQVREMAGAVRYRPLKGIVLDGYLKKGKKLSDKMTAFLDRFNRETYLIIGIESVPAYENLDALISVPGVDGVFVGPHDFTVSMGIPEEYEHPDFRRVLDDIVVRCRKAGIGVGVHMSQVTTPDARYYELMDRGMNWILYGADIALLVGEMGKRLKLLRAHGGDKYLRGERAAAPVSSCIGGRESAPVKGRAGRRRGRA